MCAQVSFQYDCWVTYDVKLLILLIGLYVCRSGPIESCCDCCVSSFEIYFLFFS
ncbi:hypothetical protein M758_8G024200 [Ceratodon purpureus]|uniref:NADH dehydrogenase subunit 1 n=1 Tax=Ceratodon purpureus TaxID=3225 RepID=A0A8T0GUK9_CERPU|nr:hypothetical protein KC19_8G025000 [Ceratodon purpureus]KAG0607387.1 hypothetical protein M758_8G024200 [Ceratodon purpureus]